jgi:hypothetical protein
LTAIKRIERRFAPIHTPDDFVSSDDGIDRLDGITMMLIAMGEQLKQLDNVVDVSLSIQYPHIDWKRYDLSQSEFAALLGVSVKTLQNWEQGRRSPHGAARVLLHVAEKHPDVLWDVVHPS